MKNQVIPEITNPLGKYWEQPDKSEIKLLFNHAWMSKKAFDKLKQYDASIPSGVYEGKMWKCQYEDGMYLRWYDKSDNPNMCSIKKIKIMIE